MHVSGLWLYGVYATTKLANWFTYQFVVMDAISQKTSKTNKKHLTCEHIISTYFIFSMTYEHTASPVEPKLTYASTVLPLLRGLEYNKI